MQDKNRMFLLSGMFIFFIIFIIFVFFYEKENKMFDVNTYYLSYDIRDDFEKEVDDYLILGIIKNVEEHKQFMEIYETYDDDDVYLNYDYNYVHVLIRYNPCSEHIKFNKVKKNDNKYDLVFKDELSCGSICGSEFKVFEIPIDKDVVDISKLNVVIKYDDSNQVNCYNDVVEKKPVLYLYPEEDVMVNVSFEHDENLLTTYPKYKNSWNVLARKDGTLIDDNKKEYYALYWDEKINHEEKFETGFYVKSEDSIKFLEDKLSEIGLTDREANEFIMYWLPILEQGGDNLVHFHFTEDREKQNKIYIEPAVDSLFRFSIEIKKINEEVKIKEQKIERFERYGFSALEWGGTIIK